MKLPLSSGKQDEQGKANHTGDGAPIIDYSKTIPNRETPTEPKNPSTNQQSLHSRLEFYQDKLLQLDRRNRSINMNHIYNKWSFDLVRLQLDYSNTTANKAIVSALSNKKPIRLVSDSDLSEIADKNRIRLRSLFRNITQIERETGLQENFLGFPFLAGHISEDVYIRGPLVLFPITLERRQEMKSSGWYLLFPKDKTVILNKALLTAIKKNRGITLPSSFIDEFEDLFDRIISSNNNIRNIESLFIEELSKLLIQYNFPLDVSKNDLSENRVLEPLDPEKLENEKQRLHLENFKIIGNFPQGDSAIYSDYEDLFKRAKSGEANQGIIDNLLEVPAPEEGIWSEGDKYIGSNVTYNPDYDDHLKLDCIPTEQLNLAIESDSSQDQFVVATNHQECTVVRGPPGTGKSQVIVNLISDALAKQKRILVVCQKRAALDVVYQRLDKIGLARYAALLHDPNKDRKPLYKQIERLLKSTPNPESVNNISSKFGRCSQEIDDIKNIQNSIADALWKPYFGGISVHQLYVLADVEYIPKLDLSDISNQIEYSTLPRILDTIRNLEPLCKKFDIAEGYPWIYRSDFSKLGFLGKNKIENLISKIEHTLDERQTAFLAFNTNAQRKLLESLIELTAILDLFSNIESACKKFDASNYDWINRSDFSVTNINGKKKIQEILDRVSSLLRDITAMILTEDANNQQILLNSLNVLATEGGLFRKLKPRWIEANSNIKKLLKEERDIPNDANHINSLKQRAQKGLELLKEINELKQFVSNKIFNEIKDNLFSASSQQTESLFSLLSTMQQSLQDYDELVDYERKRSYLMSRENELQKKWNFICSSVLQFLDQPHVHNNNNDNYLMQGLEIPSHLKKLEFDELRLISSGSSSLSADQFFSSLSKARDILTLLQTKVEKGLSIWNTVGELSDFLNEKGMDKFRNEFRSSSLDSFRQMLFSMREALHHDFDKLQAYDSNKKLLSPIENKVLEICMTQLATEDNWDKILMQECYLHWIDRIEKDNPQLIRQPFETYLQNRERLSQLIKENRRHAVEAIAKQIDNAIIRPVYPKLPKGRTGALIVREDLKNWIKLGHEVGKKRHLFPVRKLIENYESLVFNVVPCWLASPEAVSAVFPLKRKLFDIIIFDEASQTAVEKALVSLYRGDSIVITGDEKQLRPFDLFKVKADEDQEIEGEEIMDDTLLSESLLILAKRIYGNNILSWHYRSRHQELIDFSNHAFYDGDLQVAPSIWRAPSVSPLRWITCKDGSWVNRKNVPEAVLVVDELKRILSQNNDNSNENESNDTVGIITFNNAQQEAIHDEIDNRRRDDILFNDLLSRAEHPKSERLDDIPFVKNIENIQGDERDIIIFSIGYAKDPGNPEGEVSMRFGTLNQEGGENRLNVAVTRARKEIIIVCSIDPDKLNIEKTKNEGPKRMKDYLSYAKAISEGRREDARQILMSLNNRFDDQNINIQNIKLGTVDTFETVIQKELEKIGYQVDHRVGHSNYKIDLAVVHPDDSRKYILAIETDGETFHSANGALERDVSRQEFLEGKGWTVERIWSRNWWRNPNKEINRIHQKIQELRTIKSPDLLTGERKPPQPASRELEKDPSKLQEEMLEEIISKGESNTLEFKSSMRSPSHADLAIISIEKSLEKATGQDEKHSLQRKLTDAKRTLMNALEHEVLKTIAAFMNSEGGTLLVGVNDGGNVVGLDKDFHTFSDKKNWDGWSQHLVNTIDKHIGPELMNNIISEPIRYKDTTVALIRIQKSSIPVYVEDQDKRTGETKVEFYYRALNTTKELNIKQAAEYIKNHWKTNN